MKRPCQPTAREYGIYSRYISFAKRSSHISSSHAATLRGKNLTIIHGKWLECDWAREHAPQCPCKVPTRSAMSHAVMALWPASAASFQAWSNWSNSWSAQHPCMETVCDRAATQLSLEWRHEPLCCRTISANLQCTDLLLKFPNKHDSSVRTWGSFQTMQSDQQLVIYSVEQSIRSLYRRSWAIFKCSLSWLHPSRKKLAACTNLLRNYDSATLRMQSRCVSTHGLHMRSYSAVERLQCQLTVTPSADQHAGKLREVWHLPSAPHGCKLGVHEAWPADIINE